MTGIRLGLAFLLALLMLAPLAAAEAEQGNEEPAAGGSADHPDDAAWVEDCPPDMMCAFSEDGNETRGPEECEYCRYHQDEDCIDCMGPVDDTTWGTDCPEGVWCLEDGPAQAPECEGGACEYDADPDAEKVEAGEAPAPVALIVLLGVLGVVLVAAIRRA